MKLETNKRYVLRNGEVTSPLAILSDVDYAFVAFNGSAGSYQTWTADGYYYRDRIESNRDIVAVFDEAAPEPVHVNEALILHVMEVARIALRLPRVAVMIADELDLSDESMHEIISFLEFKLK